MKNKILSTKILLALVFLCFVSACGKMGDPRPRLPRGDDSLSRLENVYVSNLILNQSQEGILLRWNIYGDTSVPEKIRIYRSDFNIKDGDCQDCPPLWKRIIKEFSLEELKGGVGNDGQLAYEDRDVQQEFLYKYSLQICTGHDVCQDPSPETVVQFLGEAGESGGEMIEESEDGSLLL